MIKSKQKPVPLRCFDPVGNQYTVCLEINYNEEDSTWNYHEYDFPHYPSKEEIREAAERIINSDIGEKITTGYEWSGMKIWLSFENQRNYESILTSIQAELDILPVKLRFGTPEEPKYHIFEDPEEYKEFYKGLQKHITNCLAEGWERKDKINYDIYELTKD